MLAKYDYRNPQALKTLVGQGTKLFRFPKDMMEGAFKAAGETYAELNSSNADWKKIFADFQIGDTGLPDYLPVGAAQTPVEDLPEDAIVYLLGSRYCETDRLGDFADRGAVRRVHVGV